MEKRVFVLLHGAREQRIFTRRLAKKGYHWFSGQEITDIPRFLALPEGETHCMICDVRTGSRKVGFYPAEAFPKKEQERMLRETPGLEDLDWDAI